jgi:glyoxylase-like metal-dependent hydrolase (beta-lactamase superfamily II)
MRITKLGPPGLLVFVVAFTAVLLVLFIVARFGQNNHAYVQITNSAKTTSNVENQNNNNEDVGNPKLKSGAKHDSGIKSAAMYEDSIKSVNGIKNSTTENKTVISETIKNKTVKSKTIANDVENKTFIKEQRKRMKVKTIPVGPLETNCYMVMEDRDEKPAAIVIDPGDDEQEIMDVIERYNADVKYVVITHAHWDHIGDVAQIATRTGAKVLAHPLDVPSLNKPGSNLASLIGEIQRENIKVDREINDGDIIEFGDLKAQVLHTPGHSRGSVSVLIDDALFTGDLIFYRSIGRTDFEGGSLDALRISVIEKVFTLPGATIIYPGHGPASTVGDERMSNPYFD